MKKSEGWRAIYGNIKNGGHFNKNEQYPQINSFFGLKAYVKGSNKHMKILLENIIWHK